MLGVAAGVGAAAVCAAAILGIPHIHGRPRPHPQTAPSAAPKGPPAVRFDPSHPPPAWTGPLPYPLLVADAGRGRAVEVSPNGTVLWQSPSAPGGAPATAAAFTADGQDVVLVGEQQGLAEEVRFPSGSVLWRYPASGTLSHPTAAAPLGNGDVVVADTRACQLLLLSPSATLAATWGAAQSGYCTSAPAAGRFGYPESAVALANGDVLVGLAAQDQIALLSPQGHALWGVPAPPLFGGFVVDATPGPGSLVVVTGFSNPGTVTAFNPANGAVAWTYHPTSGQGVLNDPRAAIALPNGDVAVADSGGGRVLVFAPSTGRVLWQYGGPGKLSDPTGLALDLWRNWQGVPGKA